MTSSLGESFLGESSLDISSESSLDISHNVGLLDVMRDVGLLDVLCEITLTVNGLAMGGSVRLAVGEELDFNKGLAEGPAHTAVGFDEGLLDGCLLGELIDFLVDTEGLPVGFLEGLAEGLVDTEGLPEGFPEGLAIGLVDTEGQKDSEGLTKGLVDTEGANVSEGLPDGLVDTEGLPEGLPVIRAFI